MKTKIQQLTMLLALVSLSWAAPTPTQVPTLVIAKISNSSSMDSLAAQKIQDDIQSRLQINKGWNVLDSVVPVGERTAMIAAAQGSKAGYLLVGSLEDGSQIGKSRLVLTLVDADDNRDIQKEDMEIGPNPDAESGRIASLMKLFDPSSVASESADPKKDKLNDDVSTSASWVLGGTAVLVLMIVLYSLSVKN